MLAAPCHFITSAPPPRMSPAATYITTHRPTIPRAAAATTTTTTTTAPRRTPTVHPDSDAADDDAALAVGDYRSLFTSQRAEITAPISLRLVGGALPADFPTGTYYLTGPGLFADDHGSTVHPLDGHGYLRSFQIDGGGVEFMARYVETEAQADEREPDGGAWRFKHRGPFSVLRGGRMIGNTKVMKNVANTSVLRWGGRLFCLWEGGDPYEFEPRTLATVGKIDLVGGRKRSPEKSLGRAGPDFADVAAHFLKPILHGIFKMPAKRVLAHYKIDVRRNRLLILSTNAEDMLLPKSHFTFYEFDSNFNMVQSRGFTVPDHLMLHDWAFTDSHYILFGNRIKLDVPGSMAAVCGVSPMINALSVNPSKPTTPIYILPRFPSSGTPTPGPTVVEAPSQMWVLHVANAFQQISCGGAATSIHIQASACSYRWFNFQKMFGYDWKTGKLDPGMMNPHQHKHLPHLVQVSIELDSEGKCQSCDVKDLNRWARAADFPVINPAFSGAGNGYVYAATTSGSRRTLPHFPFHSVLKLNLNDGSSHTWSAGRRTFVGEPIFVPVDGGGEQDGYILVVEYAMARERCFLVVLDSRLIGVDGRDPVVARFEVPKHLRFPLGFHGFWAPGPCNDFI
ncbi:carotenoid cleavage dioxygenase 7, chloroplastic-like [Andrographis paniculata]|uniref:carotenoid cleavage dioxygenase 7, chloroplastic-like n=1 Tax=Andrographis paniculata TaxID=175694 RepID=UPI0021E74B21|nr:carotenoid cleavage dioxygenase 7, chloroplastic-like [Andrographis paniculata]